MQYMNIKFSFFYNLCTYILQYSFIKRVMYLHKYCILTYHVYILYTILLVLYTLYTVYTVYIKYTYTVYKYCSYIYIHEYILKYTVYSQIQHYLAHNINLQSWNATLLGIRTYFMYQIPLTYSLRYKKHSMVCTTIFISYVRINYKRNAKRIKWEIKRGKRRMR